MRISANLLYLVSFAMTAMALAMTLHCLGHARDLLALYWGAVTVFAFRFGLGRSEAE